MKSYRKDKVEDLLLSFLAEEIRQLDDPRARYVTLTGVKVTADLKSARVYWTIPNESLISVMNGERERMGKRTPQEQDFASEDTKGAVAEALSHATSYLKGRIGRELALRYTPQLYFEYDESIARGFHLDRILDSVVKS